MCSVVTLQYNGDLVDLAAYGHQQVDRFAILLDLWTNEAAYLENKRQVSEGNEWK